MNDLEIAKERRPPAIRDRISPFPPKQPAAQGQPGPLGQAGADVVSFNRLELRQILDLYGRKVASGEWRDYALDFTPQKAVFSVYRRSSECALYQIEKTPRLARKQGIYGVLAASGLVLKRGHDLHRVIAVLDKRLKLVSE